MKSSDIVIDVVKTLGPSPYLLCEISENWEYVNGKRTDTQLGYKYVIASPKLALEKVSVKIPGKKLLDIQSGEILEVDFTALDLGVYIQQNGRLALTGKATSIALASDNKK